MAHDFHKFPELRDSQMGLYYLESPHKQITEDFWASVEKVHDGDTITVSMDERDFNFPVRLLGTNAPELNEPGGHDSQSWLEDQILGESVLIKVDPKERVGKWGRILGTIIHQGLDINKASISLGWATSFEARNEGKIPDINKIFRMEQWF